MSILKLNKHQVDIWLIKPQNISDKTLLQRYRQLLNQQEHKKVDRLISERGRHDALITRAFIRTILSHYAPIEPQDWVFGKGKHGKPFIENEGVNLEFNISHAHGLIACAVSKNMTLGLDVEYIRRNSDTYKLSSRYFSSFEVCVLQALPYEQQAIDFYHYWTLKESYIKACGEGLAIPLDHFSFDIKTFNDISISFAPQRNDNPLLWQSRLFDVTNDHKMALSVKLDNTQPLQINTRYFQPLSEPTTATLPL